MKPEMTAREFFEKYLDEETTLDDALSELSAYTGKGAGYYVQFPDANLILSDEQDDFVDFADDFLVWTERK
jgi:hypothetical protein